MLRLKDLREDRDLKQEEIESLITRSKTDCIIFDSQYLDEIKRAGLIEINRTAGLNMIYINKNMSLEEIMIEYYG